MKTKTKGAVTHSMLQVLQRLSLKDYLIVGDTADRVMADLTRFAETDPADGAALEVTSRENLEMAYGYDRQDEETRKPFVFQDGIAVIPIHGTLINRFNSSWGFVTGYNYIRRMVNLALDDDDVDVIVFDVDSPGGEAAGCFELAREIMASRRVKPSLAMVDSVAASGGMALAGSATTVYAIPSARIGSIGVYRMHVSFEKALKNEGIKVTFAKAGEHKIDGNPYQDLPQAVLDEWTEQAGKTWDDFIALVAEARDMSEDAVRATQARVYRADEALDKGLINAVKTTTEAIPAWIAELGEDDPDDEEEEAMTDTKTKGSEVASGLTAADKVMIAGLVAEGIGTALASQNRATAIREHGKAKGQVALAAKLAANVAITEEDAISMIDDAAAAAAPPKSKAKGGKSQERADDGGEGDDEDDDDSDDDEDDSDDDEDDDSEEAADAARRKRLKGGKAKAKGKQPRDNVNHLDRAMGKSRQPNVGAGDGDDEIDSDDPEAQAAAILGDHHRVAGAAWSGKQPGKKKAA